MKLLVLSFIVAISASAAEYTLPSDRRIDWTSCGTAANATNWPIYTNLNSGNITSNGTANVRANIQTAIDNCPVGQVVYLPFGLYRIDTGLSITKAVELRGDGSNTVLVANGGSKWIVVGNEVEYPPNHASITANATKGATTITINGAQTNSNFQVGRSMVIDQLNDGNLVNNQGGEGACTYCSRGTGGRSQAQKVRIAGVSGNTITLEEPLYWHLNTSQSPEIGWYNSMDVTNAGISKLCLDASGSTSQYEIEFCNAMYCWARDITIRNGAARGRFQIYSLYKCTFERIDFLGDPNVPGGNQSYGFEIHNTPSHNLFVNNYAESVANQYMVAWNASGNVFAYSYVTNVISSPQTWLGNAISFHDAHTQFNLVEGCDSPQFYEDFIHGSSSHNTLFRSRGHGYDAAGPSAANGDGNAYAVVIEKRNWSNNIVAGVFGRDGFHDSYRLEFVGTDGELEHVYKFGYSNTTVTASTYDVQVTNTLIMLDNYNYGTDSIPSGESGGGQTYANSWFLSEQPSYMNKWPMIDPSNPGNYYPTNNPAFFRRLFGTNFISSGGGVGGGSAPSGVATISGTVRLSGGVTIRQ